MLYKENILFVFVIFISMLLTASVLIKKTIALFRTKPLVFLEYVLALLIPTLVFAFIRPTATLTNNSAQTLIWNLVAFVVMVWFLIPIYHVAHNIYTKQAILPFLRELRTSSHLILRLILAHAITKFLSFIWIIIFLVLLPNDIGRYFIEGDIAGLIDRIGIRWILFLPSIFFAFAFQFVNQAIILDKRGVFSAMQQSIQLFQGRILAVVWRIAMPYLFFLFISLIFGWIGSQLASLLTRIASILLSDTNFLDYVLTTIISNASGLMIIPLIFAAPTILYVELKKE